MKVLIFCVDTMYKNDILTDLWLKFEVKVSNLWLKFEIKVSIFYNSYLGTY